MQNFKSTHIALALIRCSRLHTLAIVAYMEEMVMIVPFRNSESPRLRAQTLVRPIVKSQLEVSQEQKNGIKASLQVEESR